MTLALDSVTLDPGRSAIALDSPHRPGVLILDDLPLSLALLKLELQPHGFAVWLASDAADAVHLFRTLRHSASRDICWAAQQIRWPNQHRSRVPRIKRPT